MKTKLACVLGLAALVASLICGASGAYADVFEAESSVLQTLAPDADANGAESSDKLHCVLYSDGADNCVVNTQFTVVDQPSSAIDETEPSAIEPATPVQFVDAVAVAVILSVTIAVPGQSPWDSEEAAPTVSIVESPAPDLILEAKTMVLDLAE